MSPFGKVTNSKLEITTGDASRSTIGSNVAVGCHPKPDCVVRTPSMSNACPMSPLGKVTNSKFVMTTRFSTRAVENVSADTSCGIPELTRDGGHEGG